MSCPPAAGAPPSVVYGSQVHCDESKARWVSFSDWRAAFEELRKGRVDELVHIPERSRLWRIAKHLDSVQVHQLEADLSWEPDALVGAPEERSGRLFLGASSGRHLVMWRAGWPWTGRGRSLSGGPDRSSPRWIPRRSWRASRGGSTLWTHRERRPATPSRAPRGIVRSRPAMSGRSSRAALR